MPGASYGVSVRGPRFDCDVTAIQISTHDNLIETDAS